MTEGLTLALSRATVMETALALTVTACAFAELLVVKLAGFGL